MNFYPFHIGDYAAHTGHLEPLEDLAFRRMLDWVYLHEMALPKDAAEVARAIRMKTNVAEVQTVLNEFFQPIQDGWVHARCEAEIEKMQDKQAKARASAAASVAARSTNAQRTLNERSTDAELPEPIPVPIPKKREVSGTAQDAAPPTAPPVFDGTNAEALNGKHIVPIAAAWELPESWGVDAESLGWRPNDVLREAEKFRQYWVAGKGQGTRRAVKGWRQAWSNWLEKAARDKR